MKFLTMLSQITSFIKSKAFKVLGISFVIVFVLKIIYFRDSKLMYTNSSTLNILDSFLKNPTKLESSRNTTETKPIIRLNCSSSQSLSKLVLRSGTYTAVPVATSINSTCPRPLRPVAMTFPSTALLSSPGSGNTWVRHLLQQLTGVPTGSVFNDYSLQRGGFPYEGHVKRVIVVKTHGCLLKSSIYIPLLRFSRVIVLLRNPLDAWLAQLSLTLTNDHTGYIHINTSDTASLNSSLVNGLAMWSTVFNEAFNYTGPVLPVFYEDLKSDLFSEMIRMAQFLSHPSITEFAFCCVLKQSEGSFHRKRGTQTRDEIVAAIDGKMVNEKIQRAADSVKEKHPEISKRILTFMIKA